MSVRFIPTKQLGRSSGLACFHCLVLLLITMIAPLRPAAQPLSNKGKNFWVGYGHHQFMEMGQSNAQEMVLYLGAEAPANVTVTVRGRSLNTVLNYSIPANTTIATSAIPKSGGGDARLYDPPVAFGGNSSEGLFGVSINIQSDTPIVAYAHIYGSVASGATLLLPTRAWGYAYTAINSQQVDGGGPGFSWMYVVAKDSNTKVEITPSVVTRLGKPAGVPFTVTLQKGEIYQILATANSTGTGDQLTGTTVRSVANGSGVTYPVAVFCGSSRTRGEALCGSGSGRDNDMQQAFPAHAWGTRYLTAPFSAANSSTTLLPASAQTSVYKVITRWPNTVVRRNGVALVPTSGGWYTFSSNMPEFIEADQPVMVAQYMSGGSPCNTGSLGDPEMVYLTALDQGITSARFYRNNREAIAANFVTAIVPTAGLPSLRIDGSSTLDLVYDHPRLTGYKVAVKGWAAAQASVSITCDSAFTALTYGLGSAESYGYNAGFLVRNLDAGGWVQHAGGDLTEYDTVRTGSTFRFAVRSPHRLTGITWGLSAVPGLSRPVDVSVTNPAPADSVIINGRYWYTYLTDSSYTASLAGNFDFPVTYKHPLLETPGQQASFIYTLAVAAGVATALSEPLAPAGDLLVSPNPVRNLLQVRFANRGNARITASLVNMSGHRVGSAVTLHGNAATIDMSAVPAGVYVLVLTDARTGRSIQKNVVKL